jgi:Putative MetA-pathway of phenol degradation
MLKTPATMGCRPLQNAALALTSALALNTPASAQEMEPRSYSPNPVDVTFIVAGFGRSTGGVLTDPSLPIDNVDAELNAGALGVGHTFGLYGRSASLSFAQPYISGHFEGTLHGEPAEASRSGIGDTKLRLAVNLIGAPAMEAAEFAKRKPTTTLGASLTVSAPTGEYHPELLINVGTNRWAIKPEIGVSHPLGNWYLEAIAGAWFFEDNDDFFGGQLREQDPLVSVQAHAGYQFRPRLWVAFDAIIYDGGQSTIEGIERDDRQSNSRYGVTFSAPLGRRQSLKFHWSDGATTRIGSEFMSYGVSWQLTLVN